MVLACVCACGGIEKSSTSPLSARIPQLSLAQSPSQGWAGDTLTVIAKVVDQHGAAMSGVSVQFAILSGGGAVTKPSDTTLADGTTETQWILGPAPGLEQASVALAQSGATPFTVTTRGYDKAKANVLIARGMVRSSVYVWFSDTSFRNPSVSTQMNWPDTVARLFPTDSTYNQAVAFSIGQPPAVALDVRRGENDTLVFNFTPPVAIPLTVWILDTLSVIPARVQQDLVTALGVWADNRIGLTLGPVRVIDTTAYAGPVLTCNTSPPFGDSTVINVYYSKDAIAALGNYSGYTCSSRTIFIRPVGLLGNVLTLAHELGHAFGLSHQTDASNLMNPNLTGATLNTGQIMTAWFSDESALRSVYHLSVPNGAPCGSFVCPSQNFSIW